MDLMRLFGAVIICILLLLHLGWNIFVAIFIGSIIGFLIFVLY